MPLASSVITKNLPENVDTCAHVTFALWPRNWFNMDSRIQVNGRGCVPTRVIIEQGNWTSVRDIPDVGGM